MKGNFFCGMILMLCIMAGALPSHALDKACDAPMPQVDKKTSSSLLAPSYQNNNEALLLKARLNDTMRWFFLGGGLELWTAQADRLGLLSSSDKMALQAMICMARRVSALMSGAALPYPGQDRDILLVQSLIYTLTGEALTPAATQNMIPDEWKNALVKLRAVPVTQNLKNAMPEDADIAALQNDLQSLWQDAKQSSWLQNIWLRFWMWIKNFFILKS